jgi:hypothetical protein
MCLPPDVLRGSQEINTCFPAGNADASGLLCILCLIDSTAK